MANIYQLPNEVENAIIAYYNLFDLDAGELVGTEEELRQAEENIKELQNRTNEAMDWLLQTRVNEKSDIAAITSEIERLEKLKKSTEKKVEKLDFLLERNFEKIYEGKAVQIGNFKLSYTKSDAVKIIDAAKIPKEFIKKKIEISVNKTEIKKLLKNGEIIAGVELEYRKNFNIK